MKSGKYFVYQHIRPDTCLPFYIGIGTINSKYNEDQKMRYRRAHQKAKKNNIWRKIVTKNNNDYSVKIVQIFENREDCCILEKKLIKHYGRIDLKTGILSNLTDGGDEGNNNRNYTRKYYQYDLEGNFIRELFPSYKIKEHGFSYASVVSVCTGRSLTHKNYRFSYEKVEKLPPLVRKKRKLKNIKAQYRAEPILVFKNNQEYCFLSIRFAIEDLINKNKKPSTYISKVHQCAKGKRKTAYGYVWKYVNHNK